MREIKFRVWNEMWEEMLEVSSIDFENNTIHLKSKFVNIVGDLSKSELMQFTGLKDKNGVDIYEGDFLKVHHYWNDENGCSGTEKLIGLVIFKDGAFVVSFKLWDFDLEICLSDSIIISNKIIGNIYENPELLEAEK